MKTLLFKNIIKILKILSGIWTIYLGYGVVTKMRWAISSDNPSLYSTTSLQFDIGLVIAELGFGILAILWGTGWSKLQRYGILFVISFIFLSIFGILSAGFIPGSL